MLKKIWDKKYYLFCLILAFVVLMITSKNSFLYKFNDWVDANAFFTVGKSMFNGVVPYKDLFEQKGPFLYLIYGIGYLFSHTSFHGVFILEVVSFSIFLYYAHKIFSLFLDKKYSLFLLPILAYLVTTSTAFVHGGSCEEFAFSMFSICLYYYFKHFKVKAVTDKETILVGMFCSLVFLMKYTMIGIFAGFGIIIFFDYILKKDIKKAFRFALMFFIGFFIPIILFLIYFAINHGVKEFIECYFKINITAYSGNTTHSLVNIKTMVRSAFGCLRRNGGIVATLIMILPFVVFKINLKENDKSLKSDLLFKIGILVMVGLTFFITYWGLKFYPYYLLPVFIYLIIGLLGLILFFKKYIDKIINKKWMIVLFVLVNALTVVFCYCGANYKTMLKYNKDDYFQFKYAHYIKKEKNPTLLNMGFLDGGLYTTTGIVPNTKFFEEQNLDYNRFPDNIDEMRKNIKSKEVKFILFYTKYDMKWLKTNYPEIFKNYKLVFDDKYLFEKCDMYNAFLFELKK